jgi:hypothetical protein
MWSLSPMLISKWPDEDIAPVEDLIAASADEMLR